MKKFIHNLRKRPEEHRMHILHVLTLASSLVLVVLWTYSLGTKVATEDQGSTLKEGLEPFSALKGSIIDGYKSISEPSNLYVAE